MVTTGTFGSYSEKAKDLLPFTWRVKGRGSGLKESLI